MIQMQKTSLFLFAMLGLVNISFAQPSDREIEDYIKKSCADDQQCACIVSRVAPHFASIEVIDKINRGMGSTQENEKLNSLIADINSQCKTQIKPIIIQDEHNAQKK